MRSVILGFAGLGWAAAGVGVACADEVARPKVEEIVVRAQRASRSGPGVSPAGASTYGVAARDIARLARGEETPLNNVLAQAPGVAIDQNQQIHIRNTEGPQFQYNIDGFLVPFDINTNPPFLSVFSASAVRKIDLLTGVLPARYSYATGGVVDITTKDGCRDQGGEVSFTFGQRSTLQPLVQYAGCSGRMDYFVSATYTHNDMAFSSATPTVDGIHDLGDQGLAFGHIGYRLTDQTELIATISAAASNNQLPNVPDLPPAFTLTGAKAFNSADIDSYLNFRDELGMFALKSSPSDDLSYQIGYAVHAIDEAFRPDTAGELIYQGVASRATHSDFDNTLQGDVSWRSGAHTWTAGFYAGNYRVVADDSSLVFPADATGAQASSLPVRVINDSNANNVLMGAYADDLWQLGPQVKLNTGLRLDSLTGFTQHLQLDPTADLIWRPSPALTLHGGVARYMQVPSFQGISPDAYQAFLGTTAAGSPGVATPVTEDDWEADVGAVRQFGPHISISQDFYYEITHHYLDTGQFGVVPIFAPFNYGNGTIWGSESAVSVRWSDFSAYGNVTLGRNTQRGVFTGQFNFDPAALAYINAHLIDLDHQPLFGAAFGASWHAGQLTLSADGIYSSGLRAGFADLVHLPTVLQVNAGAEWDFRMPGVGKLSNRVAVLNVFDRTNLIRPRDGIGIFQAAYGPRRTVLDTIAIRF